jgi:acyl-coenzyme A thioesterase PaaI-like protein
MDQSLQDRYGASTTCFGCGPANPQGLQIKTHIHGEEGVCHFVPEKHHEAFDGFVAGGIIGAVFDCHCNWTATAHLMERNGLDRPPATVTAEYTVRFQKPTRSAARLVFHARVTDSSNRRATVEARLEADGETTATCHAVFVAVGEGHPAHDRW